MQITAKRCCARVLTGTSGIHMSLRILVTLGHQFVKVQTLIKKVSKLFRVVG
jgi:hypothetical protein